MSNLVLVGISHHRAPVELRERAALDRERAGELARQLAGETSEAVCLSTCNRTELYLADDSAEEAERKAEAALLALEAELGPALYRLRDEAAALHLFRVAAGLRGRRAAYVLLAAFVLVAVVRLALPVTHFA